MSEIKDVGAAYDKQFERVSDTETVLREFYDKAYAAGVAAERERCALVCDKQTQGKSMWIEGARACATAIRKGE